MYVLVHRHRHYHQIKLLIVGGWNSILLSDSSQSQTDMIAMFCFNQDFSTSNEKFV